MKLLMENWRKFLKEEVFQPGKSKVIFMAGGPGSGKSTVLKNLGLKLPTVNADAGYEKELEADPELSLGGKPTVYAKKKELEAEIESLPEDSEERAIKQQEIDKQRALLSKYAKAFAQGQNEKRADYKKFTEPSESFIVDGTAGNYNEMVKQKGALEKQGYDVAMIFVDLDMETALQRNVARGQEGGRQLLDREVESSHAAVKKNKEAYESLFGKNFFYVSTEEGKMEPGIAMIQPGVDEFVGAMTENDYPLSTAKVNKQINRIIRPSKKKNAQTKLPGWKRSKSDYRGSAPPGAGGS